MKFINTRTSALVLGVVLALAFGRQALAIPFAFDGQADFLTDSHGYYYAMTGGKFPTGNTPNGARASGGTFRYITDATEWGGYTLDVWHKDGWFPENASIAMTFQYNGTTVYDNNGIEDGTYGDYYDAQAQGVDSAAAPGLYRGFSMANVYDWIYAGYFKVERPMIIDTMIGYFDEVSGFDRNDPTMGYAMNIFSNVAGDLLPTNTGAFSGDVFHMSTLTNPAGFSTADTGVDRVFGDDYNNIHDDIFKLTLKLENPIVLDAGIYWFNHNAFLVPEPATLTLLGIALAGLGFGRRRG